MARKKKTRAQKTKLIPKQIEPLTDKQAEAFNSFFENNHLVLEGLAGTGKTFLSLYLALSEVIEHQTANKVIIIRSAVPTREVGFLPGSLEEKIQAYEVAYKIMCSEIFERGGAYDDLKKMGIIEFMSSSYIRAQTLDNCIIIVDECQNYTFEELDGIMTRLGDGSTIIFCGDIDQNDLTGGKSGKSGLVDFISIVKNIDEFSIIKFGLSDIVRSGIVKKYLEAKANQSMPYFKVESQ